MENGVSDNTAMGTFVAAVAIVAVFYVLRPLRVGARVMLLRLAAAIVSLLALPIGLIARALQAR